MSVNSIAGIEGYYSRDEIPLQQHPMALERLVKLLRGDGVKRVIEIGTADGGLAHALSREFEVVSFDIAWPYRRLSQSVSFIRQDVFMPIGRLLLINMLKQPVKTALLCDGGNKIGEFNSFSPHLKTGDIIAAHDYHELKINDGWSEWPYHEIGLKDISQSIKTNNLTPHDNHKEMLRFGWGFFEKCQES